MRTRPPKKVPAGVSRKGVRIDAAELGVLVWRMNQIATLVHHRHASDSLRYDRNTGPAHEFLTDVMERDQDSEFIVEKWRGAILLRPDGTTEEMDPLLLQDAVEAYRLKKARR